MFSCTTAVRVRDASAETIKQMSRKELAQKGRQAPRMLLCHLHDEACVRIRSYAGRANEGFVVPAGSRCVARGRISKVQSNAMWARFGKACTEVFGELQPLARKGAQTLTHALVQAVGYAADAAVSQRPERARPLRLVHLLIGDGVAANMAAVRRVFRHFQQKAAFQYRLLVWSCASRRL